MSSKKSFFIKLSCALGAFVLGFAFAVMPFFSSKASYASSIDNTSSESILSNAWTVYNNEYSSGGTVNLSSNKFFSFNSNRVYSFGTTDLFVLQSLNTNGSLVWFNLGSHNFTDVPDLTWDTIVINGYTFLYEKSYNSSTFNKFYLVTIPSSVLSLPTFTLVTVSNYPSTSYSNFSLGSQMWTYNSNTYFNLDYKVIFDGNSISFESTDIFTVAPANQNLNMFYRIKSYNINYYYDGSNSFRLNNATNTFESVVITLSKPFNTNYIIFDGLNTIYFDGNSVIYRFNNDSLTFIADFSTNLSVTSAEDLPRAVNNSLFMGVNSSGKTVILNSSLGNYHYNEGYNDGYNAGYIAGYNAGITETDYSSSYNEGYNAGYIAGVATNSGYNSGYDTGYNLGYNQGYTAGQTNGYNTGYNTGSTDGYNLGYNAGVEAGTDYSFLGLMGAVIDAPIQAFSNLFNFELFGTNIKNLLLALFTGSVIIVILKFSLGGGK